MKSLLTFTLLTLTPSFAFAHGSLAQQSSDAVKSATELFTRTQAPDVRRQFNAISATLVGHEQFAVEIALRNGGILKFDCRENEKVDPVIWECTAL